MSPLLTAAEQDWFVDRYYRDRSPMRICADLHLSPESLQRTRRGCPAFAARLALAEEMHAIEAAAVLSELADGSREGSVTAAREAARLAAAHFARERVSLPAEGEPSPRPAASKPPAASNEGGTPREPKASAESLESLPGTRLHEAAVRPEEPQRLGPGSRKLARARRLAERDEDGVKNRSG